MHCLEIIQRLSATTSRRDKEQIIREAAADGSDEFFRGIRLALDPLIPFHVARVAEILEDDGAPGDLGFQEFAILAERLHRRDLTGHAARDAIRAAAERCHVPTWNLFYRRILLKDLRVGVDAKTVNAALGKLSGVEHLLIPVFECQLAHDGEDPKHQKKLRGRKLVDAKLDGVRVLAVLDKVANLTTLYTRNGLILPHFAELYASLNGLLARLPGSLVLDGELVSPQGFQHLMTLVRRKEPHPDMATVRYALFDLLPLADFRAGRCETPQHARHAMLATLQESGLWATTSGMAYVIPQVEVDLDTPEGQAAYDEFVQQAADEGYEGVMLKDPDAPYVCKRTTAWLKRKPVINVTLEIIGFAPGDPDSKYRDTLGALKCAGYDHGKQIVSNVSGGLSDEMRNQIWRDQQSYLGLLLEVQADRLTLEEGSQTYSLRFPRWKGLRGRTPAEKL